ncbi:SGNH hydrolase-type esterase domain containing protein [Elaphomyces granulatus]
MMPLNSFLMPINTNDELRILCFGDSLTAGFWHYGCEFHPYALKLKEELQKAFPDTEITVDVDGVSGDFVSRPPGRFLSRIRSKRMSQYDWVIILGGTNDLGLGLNPSEICSALQNVYSIALDGGANVLAMTVPECYSWSERLEAARNQVNTWIKSYTADRYHTFDLRVAVPYHDMPEDQRNELWDDGLHFTDEGYNHVGQLVGKHLIDILKRADETPLLDENKN